MIDVIQFVKLRPEVQKELEARYKVHPKEDLEKVAGIVRAAVTNGHSGPSPEVIDRLPRLEIIASASVGYDGIPVDYARSKGIPVTNTPDVLNDDVADLAIGLMIMTARRLVAADRYVRAGRWTKEDHFPLAQKDRGKHVGILGMGSIGKAIGRRAADKTLDPGKLDHIVAGGVPAGLTAMQTLVKEAAEEAAGRPWAAARAVRARASPARPRRPAGAG